MSTGIKIFLALGFLGLLGFGSCATCVAIGARGAANAAKQAAAAGGAGPSTSPEGAVAESLVNAPAANAFMRSVERKVFQDSIAQFEIVKNGGDAMEICVHAGMVVAAAVQAKDAGEHAKWKAVEREACTKAGLPR